MSFATTACVSRPAHSQNWREQDRRDHCRLAGDVAELLAHDDAMRVPIAVRRLVDTGIEPIVVAKTLAIGDRDGGLMYRLSTPPQSLELPD